jgi:hypothetical protein
MSSARRRSLGESKIDVREDTKQHEASSAVELLFGDVNDLSVGENMERHQKRAFSVQSRSSNV